MLKRRGRYVVGPKLSSGGMGTVHLGKLLGAAGFGRIVAIKRLHERFATDPVFVAMLIDEARLAARVHSAHVAPTLDVVQDEGELLLAMEYVAGEALHRLLREEKAPPIDIVVAILLQLLLGLHAAHEATSERGEPLCIVHRDVSPQNVLVGVNGVVRLVDFGIAKAADRMQTTSEGQIKGKFPYMAPEQFDGTDVDRRVDVYSAGILLWEAIAGERLHQGDAPAAVVRSVLDSKPRPLEALRGDVPADVAAIALQALSRAPGDRYPTALEMAQALEECSVRPASNQTIAKWVERLVGPALQARAELCRAFESESLDLAEEPLPPAPGESSVSGPPPENMESSVHLPMTKPSRLWVWGLLGVAAVLGGSLALGVRWISSAPDAARSSAASTDPESAAKADLPTPSPPPSTPPSEVGSGVIPIATSSALSTPSAVGTGRDKRSPASPRQTSAVEGQSAPSSTLGPLPAPPAKSTTARPPAGTPSWDNSMH